jgi:hypothetical protein
MIPVEHVVKRSDDVNKWHKRGSEMGEAWSAPFLPWGKLGARHFYHGGSLERAISTRQSICPFARKLDNKCEKAKKS